MQSIPIYKKNDVGDSRNGKELRSENGNVSVLLLSKSRGLKQTDGYRIAKAQDMDRSLQTGVHFGLTSGVITTLGLMVELHSGTHSLLVVAGGILTITVADAFSDALGIHISEEAENVHATVEVWIALFLVARSPCSVALPAPAGVRLSADTVRLRKLALLSCLLPLAPRSLPADHLRSVRLLYTLRTTQ